MEPENLVITTANTQPSLNPFKKIFSKALNIFKILFTKIKTFWLKIPIKFRIIIAPLIILIFIFGIYILSLRGFNPLDIIRKITYEDIVKQYSEGWIKLQVPQRESAFFTLKPQTKSKYGILPKENFTLTSKEAVSESFIREKLESNVPVKIASVSSTEFRITTEGNIKNDEVIKLSIPVKNEEVNGHIFDRNYGWTFQTQGKFRVITSIPGNEKNEVPLNTGIEITFSQDDYGDPKNLISITPSFEWRGEKHAETYAIVPLKPLNPKTIYTVTLKAGLNLEKRNDPIEEDFSFSFQTRELAEAQNILYPPRISLSKNFVQTSPNEPPTVGVYSSNWNDNTSLKTIVYKFADSNQFVKSRKNINEAEANWWSYFAEDEQIETGSLAKVSEIDLKLQYKENLEYIQLPEPLSNGYYLVQFWYENGKKLEQLWLQSTNISAYTSVGRKQTLVWVNNVESGNSVGSAQVTPIGLRSSYSTSDNGITSFPTPQFFHEKSVHYIKVSSDVDELIMPVNSLIGNNQAQQKNASDYWSYLYNERFLYKPGDTVYFWGTIKDRDTGSIPDNIEVKISAGYYSYSSENTSLKSVTLLPDSNGTFMGNVPLDNIPEGYYSLNLIVGDVNVASSGIQVTDYEKPEMKIEVTSNKKAIFSTEKNEFTAKVSFYDDSPAKKIPLNVYKSAYPSGEKSELQTDNNGEIKYTYEPKYEQDSKSYYQYPRYESITINPTLTQEANIEGFGSIYVYGSKLMISSNSRQEGKRAFLNATLNKVNLDNVNKGISSNVKGDLVANKDVNAVITKTWWERIETGTYYDFIEKVTRLSYRYERHDENILDTKLKTNSSGEISYEFDMETKNSYHLILSVDDEDKHKSYANEYYYYYEGYQTYSSDYTGSSGPELTLDKEVNSYSVGENVNLNIKYKGENFPDDDKNRFLFILAQRGNQDYFVKDTPEFSFNFNNKHIPNTFAAAVIFTGKYYQVANPDCSWDWGCSYSYYYEDYFNSLIIHYKKEDSSLELEINTGEEKYKPGDTAKISVAVKKNGQPIPNTQVNLVLVDLALEAIGGVKKPSILGSLYATIPNEIYYNYFSHKPVFPPPSQAEQGGGGGDSRELFKDTPFFGQAKTNELGIAEFEFTLPDNITTWLIYAQGLSETYDAGQSEGKIISSKDFFVTSNFPKEYLQKDISYITGNGFGGSINENQTISYEVTILKGDDQIDRKTGDGKTLKDTSFRFPDLQTGNYRAWLKGTTNNLVDGVIYPFNVVESRLDLQMDKSYKLEKEDLLESINLEGLNNEKPVKIVISDVGRGQYYNQLYGFCYVNSNRIEKKLAKSKANSVILETFGEEPCKVKNEDLTVYQNFDGGLSQVSWGGSHLETTVWAIYIDQNAFDKEKLIGFLESKLNDSRGGNIQKIYAYWGLTLLSKPHINELLLYSQNAVGFDEKIISALALASIGETEIPREIYYDLLSDYAYTSKPYIRIQSENNINDQTVDKYVNDTGEALLLGSIVEKNYNEGLFLYLRDYKNQVEDIVIDLGKIAFINEELSKLPSEDTRVLFKSNSREEIIDLSKGRNESISLLKGEIENTKFSVNSGKAEIAAYYFVTPGIFSQIQKDNRLKIKREYKKVKGEGKLINPGDIIEIKVSFDLDIKSAPLGGYTITDHLPSGLTYIKNPSMYGLAKVGWASEQINNVIKYNFYNSPWWQNYGDRSFTYFARASAVGTYVAEACVLQSNLDLSVIQSTPEETINVEISD